MKKKIAAVAMAAMFTVGSAGAFLASGSESAAHAPSNNKFAVQRAPQVKSAASNPTCYGLYRPGRMCG